MSVSNMLEDINPPPAIQLRTTINCHPEDGVLSITITDVTNNQ